MGVMLLIVVENKLQPKMNTTEKKSTLGFWRLCGGYKIQINKSEKFIYQGWD